MATAPRWPARSAASRIAPIASSLEPRSGANPPSSPTAVASPRSCSTAFSAWNVSEPMRSASANVGAPTGTSMNSWRSIEFCACAPPLITFIIGTGSVRASSPPSQRYSGTPASAAAAFAVAIETPRIAFAPSRPLFGVPSRSIIARSTGCLVVCVEPAHGSGELALDVRHRLGDALAAVRVAAVAQLHGLELPGRRARRDGRAAERTGVEEHVDLDGRVAPRIEDLTGVHIRDRAQRNSSLAWSKYRVLLPRATAR